MVLRLLVKMEIASSYLHLDGAVTQSLNSKINLDIIGLANALLIQNLAEVCYSPKMVKESLETATYTMGEVFVRYTIRNKLRQSGRLRGQSVTLLFMW